MTLTYFIYRRSKLKQRPMPHSNGGSDPEVVHTPALAAVVKAWTQHWRADRPVETTGRWRDGRTFQGALPWLSHESGISERRIQNIMGSETKTTSLRVADELLVAMGEHWRLYVPVDHGGIAIVPNPAWSNEYWQRYMAERGGCSDG